MQTQSLMADGHDYNPTATDGHDYPGIPSYSQDPNFAWEKEKVKQTVTSIKPQDWTVPQPENHTRFVCISGEEEEHL